MRSGTHNQFQRNFQVIECRQFHFYSPRWCSHGRAALLNAIYSWHLGKGFTTKDIFFSAVLPLLLRNLLAAQCQIMLKNAEWRESLSIYFFNRRWRNRILQDKGKAWAGFLELVIHTSEEFTEISRMFRSVKNHNRT